MLRLSNTHQIHSLTHTHNITSIAASVTVISVIHEKNNKRHKHFRNNSVYFSHSLHQIILMYLRTSLSFSLSSHNNVLFLSLRHKTHDPDLGLNGKVRYEILPGEGAREALTKFTVDPATGQVRRGRRTTEERGGLAGWVWVRIDGCEEEIHSWETVEGWLGDGVITEVRVGQYWS